MRSSPPRSRQGGFTFVWVLLAIAVLGIGLTAVSEVATTTARRQKQAELDWAGAQLAQAIGSYYYATPSAQKAYPRRLDELLEDRRYGLVRRHLREIYRNPFTGRADWELLSGSDGGIRGVRAIVVRSDGVSTKDYAFQP